MIQPVGGFSLLLQLVLLVVTPHCARGFSPQSRVDVSSSPSSSSSSSKLAYGRLSSDAWSPVLLFEAFMDKNKHGTNTTNVIDIEEATTDAKTQDAVAKKVYDVNLFVVAAIPPILAFMTYGQISHGLAYWFDVFGFNGSNVDGNAFAINLLRPTLNGVVVPATGVGLGTLFATTVNVLWNRQLNLRSTINKEVCELRLLRRALFGCFGTAQHSQRRATALEMLHSYTQTLMSETDTVECIKRLEATQATGGGISMNELDELAELLHGVDGAAASRESSVSKAGDLLVSLTGHRSERVATTLSGFPSIHWFLMDVLYFCIVLSFLVDSNQEVNQYLNSVQLQVLFAILASVGSGAAMLLKDLEDPFQGSFCINLAAKQLASFEELLETDIKSAESESQQVGRSALAFSRDRNRQRPNYNAGNTVYFHLLTGPLGGNIRALGDIFAWTYRQITKTWRACRVWPRRFRKSDWD